MTFDNHKLNQLQLCARCGIFTQQINIASGISYIAVYLTNVIFPTPIRKEDQKQFIFTWDRQSDAFSLTLKLCWLCTLCHNIVQMKSPGSSRHYTKHHKGPLYWWDHVNQTRGARTDKSAGSLVHVLQRVQEKPYKQWSFKGSSDPGYQNIPSKVKHKLLYLGIPVTKNDTWYASSGSGNSICHTLTTLLNNMKGSWLWLWGWGQQERTPRHGIRLQASSSALSLVTW